MTYRQNGTMTSSQLSSSVSSLSPSKQGSSELSRVYKQASQLYLTRRLSEALSTLQPIISAPNSKEDRPREDDEPQSLAPIATASSKLRIKIWVLYISLLNAINDLGPDEGKKAFGTKDWKSLVSSVRDGEIWETIVSVGYRGREGSVDAEIVSNLATLLLAQAPSQSVNQQRLETYLSTSHQPDLDFDSIQRSPTNGYRSRHNGTDTPRDLDSRVKIMEIFTLHVLPRNNEWEYAKEFINMSEVLDEERREAFLQTLEQLRDDRVKDGRREEDIQKERDEELAREREEEQRQRAAELKEEEDRKRTGREGKSHKKTSSEVDYGIEKTNPNGKSISKAIKPANKAGKDSTLGRTTFSPPPKSPNQARRPTKSSTDLFKQARVLMSALRNLVKNMAQSVSANPMALLRTMFLLAGIILAFSRRDVRERLRRITGAGWEKMKNTVGMGVKVSYI